MPCPVRFGLCGEGLQAECLVFVTFTILPSVVRHRARTNLDRHPNYILAAYMVSGT